MRTRLMSAALASTLFAVAGCESVDSTDVRTDGLYADLEVRADGSGTSIAKAALKVGGANSNTFLDLTEGDELVALQGTGASASMSRHELLGAIWYEANFPTEAADAPFKISFNRDPAVDVSAPESNVTLPTPYAITAPVPDTSFSRASAAIDVTWSPSGSTDVMTWAIVGSCIVSAGNLPINGDPGILNIPAGSILPAAGHEAESCDVEIIIHRTRAGGLDPAYGEGGHIYAKQVRTVDILSAP